MEFNLEKRGVLVPKHFRMLTLCVVLMLIPSLAFSQSTNATITGQVADPTKAVLPQATVRAINNNTNVRYEGRTNQSGTYVISSLPPGDYRVEVEKPGFKTIVKPDIVLHVQDTIELNFEMALGSASETLTVTGGAPLVNTQNAAVSTVVDRNFAEKLPMNGRSFQTLIELTPGVVLTASTVQDSGQFSVNGERASSNYWMVDGVSANIGMAGIIGPGNGPGGAVGAFTVQGGTNGLVSVDALEEFRIQTSTYAPEFGRTPGGQISIVTRSGTNQFHGTLFDYLRNDALDANDWFATRARLPKPKERQNDFGGTFSGPILRDRTFFFFSYEGLRLRLPQVAQTTVPSLNARQIAIPATQPLLNAYPQPTEAEILDANGKPTGRAPFSASYSDSSTLNATSIRIDHNLADRLYLFGRYNNAPSELSSRGQVTPSAIRKTRIATQTTTVGVTWAPSPRVANDLRLNYSRNHASTAAFLDQFGGAVPLTDAQLAFPSPFTTRNSLFTFAIPGLGGPSLGNLGDNLQRQVNVVDGLSLQKDAHTLKFGADYRRLTPVIKSPVYTQLVQFRNIAQAEAGTVRFVLVRASNKAPMTFNDLGLFAQDTWYLTSRVSVMYGLRWDIDFAPRTSTSPGFAAVTHFNDLSQLNLAPSGTSIFKTSYGNIAPRLGVSYQVSQRAGWQTVLRGGFGVFYDLATADIGEASIPGTYPFGASKLVFGGAYPVGSATAAPPVIGTPPLTLFAFDPRLKLPYSLEWNVAIEQALGAQQTLSASYIGAAGRRLLQTEFVTSPNPNVSSAQLVGNEGASSYNALQLQFRRRLSHGLQALASYTWSHSIDTASASSFGKSSNILVRQLGANDNRGPSDFDVRHTLSVGVTYEIPELTNNAFFRTILKGWSIQNVFQARSALPASAYSVFTFVGSNAFARADVVPGQPLYLYGSQCLQAPPAGFGQPCPGGKGFNPNAFTNPPLDANGSPLRQGTSGRNALRGFGAWQWDFGLHREFPITESLRLQFRAEVFNILNHPNFATPRQFVGGSPPFGLSSQMLGASLNVSNTGGGSLSPLYQFGGPRSAQFALKLVF